MPPRKLDKSSLSSALERGLEIDGCIDLYELSHVYKYMEGEGKKLSCARKAVNACTLHGRSPMHVPAMHAKGPFFANLDIDLDKGCFHFTVDRL